MMMMIVMMMTTMTTTTTTTMMMIVMTLFFIVQLNSVKLSKISKFEIKKKFIRSNNLQKQKPNLETKKKSPF